MRLKVSVNLNLWIRLIPFLRSAGNTSVHGPVTSAPDIGIEQWQCRWTLQPGKLLGLVKEIFYQQKLKIIIM